MKVKCVIIYFNLFFCKIQIRTYLLLNTVTSSKRTLLLFGLLLGCSAGGDDLSAISGVTCSSTEKESFLNRLYR